MPQPFFRVVIITLVSVLLGSGVYYTTDLEVKQGLDTLFKLRGVRTAPPEVVIVAMDEKSESRLGVGRDLTRWRRFHSKLVQQLQRQGAALVIFDLQFIVPHLTQDREFANAMKAAGNVLVTDCLQKINEDSKEYSGREECSDANTLSPISENEEAEASSASSALLLRKVKPTPVIAKAALDHAPFFLSNDAGNATVREVFPFLDMFSETPTIPIVSWIAYLHRYGALPGTLHPQESYSVWISKQRKRCLESLRASENKNLIFNYESVLGHSFMGTLSTVLCHESTQYLDYYGPPQTLRFESYSDVYDGDVQDLQGKVIFVGKSNRFFSPGKTDFFPTPFTDTESGEMAGVEIMATHFANLLEGRFINAPVPPILVFLCYGLLIGIMLISISGFIGISISLIISCLYLFLAVWCFERNAFWLPILVPLLLLVTAWVLVAWWSRRDLLEERKRIIAFVKQVFPQWISFLPASPGKWYPDQITNDLKSEQTVFGLCLATDIEGYTSVASRHTPHEMWELLNDYYKVLGHPVTSRKGVIADITGDAMMSVWLNMTDTTQRLAACLAALDMELAVERFNEASTKGQLPTRIGLFEGEITLGRIEAGDGSVYRAIGDTVNTASRIQGVNKYLETQILASKAIVKGLTEVVCRPVGIFCVIGRTESVELVEIVGLKSTVTSSQLELHERFAIGLTVFQKGNWHEADVIFQGILKDHREDGPSKFYLNYIRSRAQAEWNGVVTLSGK